MSDSVTTLHTERLTLRRLAAEHAPQVVAFYRRNLEFLVPTSPPRPEGFYDEAYWRRASEEQGPYDQTRRVSWLMFPRDDGSTMVGFINLSEIIRGPFRACFLGYGLDEHRQGQGLMTEGLRAVTGFAFEVLRLNRVMANYLADNDRSAAVLERLGFEREGFSRGYLFIDGAWRDHVLTALRNPSPPAV